MTKTTIEIGSLVQLKPLPKNDAQLPLGKKRSMSAKPGAVAIVVSEPYNHKWGPRKLIEVIWVDKKADGQSNGGYHLSDFAPITDEQYEAIHHGKKGERYAELHIASLAHWFGQVAKGLKPLHAITK